MTELAFESTNLIDFTNVSTTARVLGSMPLTTMVIISLCIGIILGCVVFKLMRWDLKEKRSGKTV